MGENPQKQEQNPHPNPLPSPYAKASGYQNGEGKKKSVNFFLLFELGIEFAVILGLPLIGGVFLGKWLDAKYGTKFIIIICILMALALSWYMIYRKIKEIDSRLRGNDK